MLDTVIESGVNWLGIAISTAALALFFILYRQYRTRWRGVFYRRDGAAPKLKRRPLGGWNGWKGSIAWLPITALLVYFGFLGLFVGRLGTYIATAWCWAWALVLVTLFYLAPMYRSVQKASHKREEKIAAQEQAVNQYPGDDAADYKVVSPYEPLDSDRRPWWRRRGRNSVNDPVA